MKIQQLLHAALLSAALLVAPGCGTTPATKIAQGEQVLITSVKDGMAEWRDYVNAGKAKRSQIDKVEQAYNAYYTAQQVVKAVLLKMAAKDPGATADDAVTANQGVVDAESALLGLLNSYLLHK